MALTDNLRAAYKLDDTSDYSGNSFTLTNVGTTPFNAALIGNGGDFGNGNTTRDLQTPDVGIAIGDDWTVSLFWKAPTSYGNNLAAFQVCYGASGSGNNNRFMFIRDAANGRWSMFNSGFTNSFTTEAITAGNWYHLCFVKSGATTTFYVNNVSKASLSAGATTNFTPGVRFSRPDDATWDCSGIVDLFYVWNRALDSTDRATMYNSGAGYEIPIGGGATPSLSRLLMMGVG